MIGRSFVITTFLLSFLFNNSLSQNLIKNPGFESGTLSPYWPSWSASSAVIIDNSNAIEGNYCAKLGNGDVYLYQPVNLEPNRTYTMKASIKTASGDVVYFGVSDVWNSAGAYIVYNDKNYKTASLSFTTGANLGNNPCIYIWKGNLTGTIWVDNIVLAPDPLINPPDEPGGMGVYYVSPSGSDSNTGTSPAKAWRTIDKVNKINFEPGDQILFEGGKTFYGTIILNYNDYGTSAKKIKIGSYGSGNATINAQTKSGFVAYDCNNIVLGNLNFTGNGRLKGNTGNGVVFSYCSEISVDNVEISGFQHSGLEIQNTGKNLSLKNIYSHNNGYAGICISGLTKTALSNVYMGYCTAYNNPGDPTVVDDHSGNGIIVYHATNTMIEYCTASYNGWDMAWTGNGPGGIWVAEVDRAIIQHCISHNNQSSSSFDGLGFDLDGGTTNSIIQYCLSYNNFGAGFGLFQYSGASDWRNNTIRYCISENDGNITADGSVYLWNGTRDANKFQGLEFYNNVVYNSNGPALTSSDHYNSGFNFRNNIFISKSTSVYNGIKGENFQGNCWYSSNGKFIIGAGPAVDFNQWAQANNQEMYGGKIVGMYANPMLVKPGYSSITDPTKLASVGDYKVKEGSVVTDAGLDLYSVFKIDPGTRDYFGNPVKQGKGVDIGIHEKTSDLGGSGKLGYTDIYSNSATTSDRRAMPVTFTEDGDIQSITIYHNGGTGNMLLGVYSDASGLPSSKLGVTASTLVNASAGWQTVPLSSPVHVNSGQTVWLSWVFQNSTAVRYTSGTPGRARSSSTWSGGMPADFGICDITDYKYSIYCTYNTGTPSPTLTVSPASISVGSASGSTGTFDLTSNTSWNVADNASWLTVSPASGSNNGTVKVTATSDNTGASPRTATITVSGTGVSGKTLTVTQAGSSTANNTFGYTDVYGLTATVSDRRAMPVTVTEDGYIQSITIYHNGSTGNMLLGVYSDASGLPSSNLAVTASTKVNTSAGWQTVPLSSPVHVNAGQTVWLSWVFQNSTAVRYTTGTPGRARSSGIWSGGMPADFGTCDITPYRYSIYCTYSKGESILTASLGYTDVYDLTAAVSDRRAMPVTFTEDGEIQSITIYHNGGTGNILLGVYSDASGLPFSNLGVTATTQVNASAGWQTVPLSSPVPVKAGQTVWLSWVFEKSIVIRYTSGTPGRARSSGTWSGGMPADFGTCNITPYRYSVYCTYTPVTSKSAEINAPLIAIDEAEQSETINLTVYPNPFTDYVMFEFLSPNPAQAQIDIYDMTGRKVATIFESFIEDGMTYNAEFKPDKNTSAMYIYRMTMGDEILHGKIIYKKQ